jgi:G3E family GTPase
MHSLFLNDGSLIDIDLSKNEIGKRETYLSAHHNHHNHQHHHKDKERNTPHFACTDATQERYQRFHHPQDSHHHQIYRKEDNFNSKWFSCFGIFFSITRL